MAVDVEAPSAGAVGSIPGQAIWHRPAVEGEGDPRLRHQRYAFGLLRGGDAGSVDAGICLRGIAGRGPTIESTNWSSRWKAKRASKPS